MIIILCLFCLMIIILCLCCPTITGRCCPRQVREMKPCSKGLVFSIRTKQCVPANSVLDDCDEMIFSLPVQLRASNASRGSRQAARATGERLLWHPQFSQSRDATPRLQLEPVPIMAAESGS